MSTSSGNIGFWNLRSCRLYLTLLFCFAVLANALIRNALSMAIVCMVNKTAVDELHRLSENKTTPIKIVLEQENATCLSVDSVKSEYDGPFLWSSSEQGQLFSALFIGGLISILPSGFISDRYNPKLMVTVGLLSSTVGCYLTPITAYRGGFVGVFALRFIMGFFGQAIILTGISSIQARWIPPTERSTVIALWSAGNQIANIIGMPMNAFLCQSKHFWGGWPLIFYVNGTFGILACILWVVFASNRPDTHRFITEREKSYITKSLANQNLGQRKGIIKKLPWRKVLTSPVVLTCLFCNFTGGFFVTVLMVYLPTYFKEALFLNLRSNGLFSALPYVSQWTSKVIFATVADSMKKKTKVSHTLITKCFNSVGTFGASLFLIACAYIDCHKAIMAVVFLSLANTMFSGIIPGFATSLTCIAPAYSGIIGAFGRFAGQIGACFAPFIVSSIIIEGTVHEWRIVFFVIASLLSFSGAVFMIFGSADIQDWAMEKKKIIIDNGINEKELKPLSDTLLNEQRYNVKQNGESNFKDTQKV